MTKRDPKLSDEYRIEGGNDLYTVECLIGDEWETIYPCLSHAEAVRWIRQISPRGTMFTIPGELWRSDW